MTEDLIQEKGTVGKIDYQLREKREESRDEGGKVSSRDKGIIQNNSVHSPCENFSMAIGRQKKKEFH